jgi:hypothetical protein
MTLACVPLRTTGVPLGRSGRRDLPRDIVVTLVRGAMRPASGLHGSTHFADSGRRLALAER